jgi:probable selenium-dependent hydroxylase accessory protein YqeC
MGRFEAPLREALGIVQRGELVSIVGGGGKTSLLFALGEGPGRWVVTTTTRIFAAQIARAPAWCSHESPGLERALDAGVPGLLVTGPVEGEKAFGVPPDRPARILAHPNVDGVAVEADGSRMRPTKAPAAHEPVVPGETTLLVVVAGIDALAGPLGRVAHRPELVQALTGTAPDEHLTPAALARLLAHPEGGCKGAPEACRVAVLLNKVESEAERRLARETALALAAEPRIDRILVGALRAGAGAGWQTFADPPVR